MSARQHRGTKQWLEMNTVLFGSHIKDHRLPADHLLASMVRKVIYGCDHLLSLFGEILSLLLTHLGAGEHTRSSAAPGEQVWVSSALLKAPHLWMKM